MLTFELVTLKGVKFTQDVWQITLPTENGQISIFPHHMPLVSLASPGVISVRVNQNDADKDMEHFATFGGIIEIDNKRVRVLVDEADHSEEVTEDEAKQALENAKTLAKQAPDDQSLEDAMSQITLQQSRLRIAELRNRHRTHKKVTR